MPDKKQRDKQRAKIIIDSIQTLIDSTLNKASFNKKKKAVIQSLNSDGTVDITINNELFKNVEVRAGLLPFVGEVVRVEMSNNSTKEMFIDTAKNTIIGDGETLHTHSNLTTLQSITQSLINAWNSAASHISDDIKHITSDERTLWNTVENKVDSSRVLTDVPIGAKFTDTIYTHPISHPASIITESTTKKFVTDTEKDTWNAKETPIDAQAKVDAHANKINNPHNVTKAQVGLGNVDDKSSVTILSEITNSNVVNALGYTPLNSVLKGSINGVAELDENGKVLSSQLPSYVDDVLEFQSIATFPTIGESGKIYVATDTNLTYRWTGTIYIEISPSVALGETSSTAYRGDRGKTAYEHSQNIHARTDATKVETSTTNGNIKIDGIETNVYTHPTNHDDRYYTEIEIDNKLAGKSDTTHNHTLSGLSEKNYTSLSGRPADDNFNTLSALIESTDDDTLLIYDTSASAYKKITKANLMAGLANDSTYVFIKHQEEHTATSNQVTFNLIKGSYQLNTDRMGVYIWGAKQPLSAYTETSSTSVTLSQGVEEGTKVIFEYISVVNALDFIHVENHKIGGIDPLTPANIGASAINHDHDGRYYTETEVNTKLNDKVDKVTGKGLSTEDYTTVDKTKLSGIATGAEVNQNTFSNIKVGTTTVAADSKTDTLELVAGTGITLTPDVINDKITIAGLNQYVHPNHTGDVVSTGDGATVIGDDKVTNTKLANMVANTIKGNDTTSTSDPKDLTVLQVKEMLALNNVTNTAQVPLSLKGVADGVAELDNTGKVPASQLPSYVDDVIEGYLSGGKFFLNEDLTSEITGESGKIYIDLISLKTYRWGGTAYVVISETLALGETSSTAYRGDRGKIAYDHSQVAHAPSNAQKNSDITQAEIEAKLIGNITTHEHTVIKSDVGLGNVDNTSDVNKPVSTAQQAVLNLKANLDSPTFTGNPTAPTQTNGNNSTSIATTEFVQSALSAGGYGDMLKSQYDIDGDGIVDNAEKVNGLTVETAVPSGAKFTDTVYSHPSTHPYSMITGTPTSLPANGGSATTAKHLIGDDTRNDNFPPSEYMSGGSRYEGRAGWQTEFKRTTIIGVNSFLSGTYCFLETKTPWSDPSGGYPVQIAYGNGHPCWRVGISTTEWGLWQVLISKPYYAGTSAPSNTNLLWVDTN